MSYVCGRVGEHVDEFLLLRNHQDPCWLRSPWKNSTFVFGGIQLQRVQNHTILLSQEQFCNDFRPVVIENKKKRAKNDKTFRPKSRPRGVVLGIRPHLELCFRLCFTARSEDLMFVLHMRGSQSSISQYVKCALLDLGIAIRCSLYRFSTL